jgi:pSer/pThr/pTyr-binding forkhead associated (FHA) protein
VHLLSLTDGPSILLDKPILMFGRHEECDVQLNSKKVSRRHCCLAVVNSFILVRDLGSTNGVKINGERVVEGRLQAGDQLQIGNFKYQVCETTGEASISRSEVSVEPIEPMPSDSEVGD